MIQDSNLFEKVLAERLKKRFNSYIGIPTVESVKQSIILESIEEIDKVFVDFGIEPLSEEEKGMF